MRPTKRAWLILLIERVIYLIVEVPGKGGEQNIIVEFSNSNTWKTKGSKWPFQFLMFLLKRMFRLADFSFDPKWNVCINLLSKLWDIFWKGGMDFLVICWGNARRCLSWISEYLCIENGESWFFDIRLCWDCCKLWWRCTRISCFAYCKCLAPRAKGEFCTPDGEMKGHSFIFLNFLFGSDTRKFGGKEKGGSVLWKTENAVDRFREWFTGCF